jgi:hypothetical protein
MNNKMNRLNLLLSDILQTEPSVSTKEIYQGSSIQTVPSLTFVEHDYHPSITATTSMVPLLPRRNSSSLKHQRQRPHIHQSDIQQQQQQQPLLNSSTLDDLFRALTLECEQYLADSSRSSYQNKTYGQLIIQPSPKIPTNVDSNDDDYENLHKSTLPISNGISSLKTSIEVISPQKRQVVSISVSSKLSSSPTVSSSQTYPFLSTCITPSVVRHSSEENSIDVSSSSTNRKRRRRIRKQPLVSSTIQSNSSSDEQTETKNGPIMEKKATISRRSCSTDYRQQRMKSIYDNTPIASQKYPTRRTRRRDISLQQQQQLISTKYYPPRFPENLCSPLSVLLTSTRSTSDFVDRSQQQRRSRLELVNHQPLTLLDRMHQQFYRPSPTRHNYNNIPTHRIPSYPVY